MELKKKEFRMTKAVIFDVDGVLLDSLPDHLEFAQEMKEKFSVATYIPTVDEVKRLLQSGHKLSPMEVFFTAIGFTPDKAKAAADEYEKSFSDNYLPAKYDGVDTLLTKLSTYQRSLGIVTANTTSNIKEGLGDSFGLFKDPALIYCKDTPGYTNKVDALTNIVSHLKMMPSDVLYIGDQYSDYDAATTAGLKFVGVTYGWCFDFDSNKKYRGTKFANNPLEILLYL
jgi:phosphoglycolate phosphatase-like HAD superfamily hydrolase